MSEDYHQRLARIKSRYPRAYERWTKKEQDILQKMILSGNNITQISQELQRRPSAIRSRVAKLKRFRSPPEYGEGITRRHQESTKRDINLATELCSPKPLSINFTFEWHTVLRRISEPYCFPDAISTYMRHRYKWPAVYRWKIYQLTPDKPDLLYIGTAKKLCPDRINSYIQPGSSKTNRRLSGLFRQYLDKGYRVGLDIFVNKEVVIGNETKTHFNLNTQSRRLIIEHLLINHYHQQGVDLLNK